MSPSLDSQDHGDSGNRARGAPQFTNRAGRITKAWADATLLPKMFLGAPAVRREMLLAEFQRLVFERGRECVVPAIEESEHRDHADDLDHLLVAPVLVEFDEHVVGYGIWHASGGDGDIERRALGRIE